MKLLSAIEGFTRISLLVIAAFLALVLFTIIIVIVGAMVVIMALYGLMKSSLSAASEANGDELFD